MPAHLHAVPAGESANASRALPIRVLLGDDHSALRRSLKLLIDHEADMRVIAEAGDLETVMRHVRRQRPQVLVLDLRLPDGSYVESIRTLLEQAPGSAVVITTMHRNRRFAERAIMAGALGFVLKDTADTELPAAVRRAANGLRYISPLVS